MKALQSNKRLIEDVLRSDKERHCINSTRGYCTKVPEPENLYDGSPMRCNYDPSTCGYFKKEVK